MSLLHTDLENYSKEELLKIIHDNLEEKKSLEYLLDNLNGVHWQFDLKQNKFIYVSGGTKKLLGYEPQEWVNLDSWALMIHPEDRERVVNYCTAQTHNAKDHFMEYRMVKKNGEVIWVIDSVTLAKDSDNKVEVLHGFIFDITEKKEQTLKLEKEHQFLQTIIDGISDPVMIINADYSVNVMNKEAQKSLQGKTFLDPKRPKCYEISHSRDTPCSGDDDPCPLKRVLETAQETKVIHNHKHLDGKDRFVELIATPLLDSEGNCRGIIETGRDITTHVELSETLQLQSKLLEYEATHDYLTGLPNRALFMDRLSQAMKDSRRNTTLMALFFIDLDEFKQVNDTYGHDVGDIVLKETCLRVKKQIRENDMFSRLAGDEFTIIVKDAKSIENITNFAQKIIKEFEPPMQIKNHTIALSLSIGIQTYNGNEKELETLLNQADKAMYKAKQQGRNNFQFCLDDDTSILEHNLKKN